SSKLSVPPPSSSWDPGSDVTVTASYPYSISLLGLVVKSGRLSSTTTERVEWTHAQKLNGAKRPSSPWSSSSSCSGWQHSSSTSDRGTAPTATPSRPQTQPPSLPPRHFR